MPKRTRKDSSRKTPADSGEPARPTSIVMPPTSSPGALPRVVMEPAAIAAILAHAAANPEVEVCGVIVGTYREEVEETVIQVTAAIEGVGADQRGAHVTFTHETWNHINREMDTRHAGRQILGWYHSHPGFGVFLSEMDEFIHRSFFGEPHQVALVYDPLAGETAIFARRGADLVPLRHYDRGSREVALTSGERQASDVDPDRILQEMRSMRDAVARLETVVAEGRRTWLDEWIVPGLLMAILLLLAFMLFLAPTNRQALIPAVVIDRYGRIHTDTGFNLPGARDPRDQGEPRAPAAAERTSPPPERGGDGQGGGAQPPEEGQ